MPDYERSTEATTLDGLPEPIRAAVLGRAEAAQRTVAADAPACLTLGRRLKKPGLLGWLTGTADRDAEHLTALVLGGRDVLVATHGEQRGTRCSPHAWRTSRSARWPTAWSPPGRPATTRTSP